MLATVRWVGTRGPPASQRPVRRSTCCRMTQDTAAWAAAQFERVRDDPLARMALLSRTYDRLCVRAPRFRRAALSFMRWQAGRGVLRPPDADPAGIRWWRAVNERLLRDGCEAVAHSAGLGASLPRRRSSFGCRSSARRLRVPGTARTTPPSFPLSSRTATSRRRNRSWSASFSTSPCCAFFMYTLLSRPPVSPSAPTPPSARPWEIRAGVVGAYLSLGRVLPNR